MDLAFMLLARTFHRGTTRHSSSTICAKTAKITKIIIKRYNKIIINSADSPQ